MKKFFKKLIYILPLIILVFLVIVLCHTYQELEVAKKIKENSVNFNKRQKQCDIVGVTNNYIYLSLYDKEDKAIQGSKWELTDSDGKQVAVFETNSEGNGGLVGLEYGEYFLQEKEVPKGYKLQNYRFRVIISPSDTSYYFLEYEQIESSKIILSVADKNGNEVEGAEYQLSYSTGENIKVLKTNKNGISALQNVPEGTYCIQELNNSEAPKRTFKVEKGEVEKIYMIYDKEE